MQLGTYLLAKPMTGLGVILTSEIIVPIRQDICLELFYMMHGADVGELKVYKNTLEGDQTLLWKRVGNHGNTWRHALIDLDKIDIYITIIASGSTGERHHIAIDDVTIADCSHFSKFNCHRIILIQYYN